MTIKILELSKKKEWFDPAFQYFWTCWGNEYNFNFYGNCIKHALEKEKDLPKFYIALLEDQIVGSYALLRNDMNSRQDLHPWLACLHVSEGYRYQGLAGKLLKHGIRQAAAKGFETLYLATELEYFYEKKGWTLEGLGFDFSDNLMKVYKINTGMNKENQ